MNKEKIIKNVFFVVTLVLLKLTIDFLYEQYSLSNKENIEKAYTDYDPSVLDDTKDDLSTCLGQEDFQSCLKLENAVSKLYSNESYTFYKDGKETDLKANIEGNKLVISRKDRLKIVKCITNFPKYEFKKDTLEIYFTENEKLEHYLICTDKFEIIVYKNKNVKNKEIEEIIKDSVLLK